MFEYEIIIHSSLSPLTNLDHTCLIGGFFKHRLPGSANQRNTVFRDCYNRLMNNSSTLINEQAASFATDYSEKQQFFRKKNDF